MVCKLNAARCPAPVHTSRMYRQNPTVRYSRFPPIENTFERGSNQELRAGSCEGLIDPLAWLFELMAVSQLLCRQEFGNALLNLLVRRSRPIRRTSIRSCENLWICHCICLQAASPLKKPCKASGLSDAVWRTRTRLCCDEVRAGEKKLRGMSTHWQTYYQGTSVHDHFVTFS